MKSMGKAGVKALDLWLPTSMADLVEMDQPGRGKLIVESDTFVMQIARFQATNIYIYPLAT
jgi:hypothetical protein